MIQAEQGKYVLLTPPAAIKDNSSFTVAELDTLGWDYCEILVILGATDIAFTAITLQEGDVTATMSNVTAGTWGTANNHLGVASTLPVATDDNKIFKFELDLRKRKRFIDLTLTIGDGTAGGYAVVLARLSRGEITPYTAAEAGCMEIIRL